MALVVHQTCKIELDRIEMFKTVANFLYTSNFCQFDLGARKWMSKVDQAGIYRWSIILADSDYFQQLESVSAPDYGGRLNRPI